MADKFQKKYRIESARLKGWDYSRDGAYFVTICTANRENYFGEIINRKIKLTNLGVLADVLWHEIKSNSSDIVLDAFVVMPNHVHGILILNSNSDSGIKKNNEIVDNDEAVETRHALSLENKQGENKYQSQRQNTVSSIIGSYKSAVSKHANRLGYEFGWQSRFYDHIIRDEKSFNKISNYIINNPSRWGRDRFS